MRVLQHGMAHLQQRVFLAMILQELAEVGFVAIGHRLVER